MSGGYKSNDVRHNRMVGRRGRDIYTKPKPRKTSESGLSGDTRDRAFRVQMSAISEMGASGAYSPQRISEEIEEAKLACYGDVGGLSLPADTPQQVKEGDRHG